MSRTIHTELSSLVPTDLDAGLVFSGVPSGRMIAGYATPCSYTPKPDTSYLFHESSRDVVVWLMSLSDPLYLYGPTGSGKTSLIKQLASRLNYPVFEITGHERLELADLVGHLSVSKGTVHFAYGPLSLAMRYGGLVLFNELDLTNPAVAAGLNSVLDGEPLCIPENGGELITPHSRFRFCATGNSNGGSDETGLYQGVQRQSAAFLDRFILCEVGYPAPDVEKDLLARIRPELPEDIRNKMVDFANEIRRLFMGEADGTLLNSIEVTLSTRTLLRWAEKSCNLKILIQKNHLLNSTMEITQTLETMNMKQQNRNCASSFSPIPIPFPNPWENT